ncbi:hypothetical protein KKH43_06780 [Patescibacteria group bacterium]|nr:hypothetical protein [Patescibacteria group bacterium]
MKRAYPIVTIFHCLCFLIVTIFGVTTYAFAVNDPGEVCNASADCGSGYICEKVEGSSDNKKHCVKTKGGACLKDIECRTGNCVYNQCRGDKSQGDLCSFDNDCQAPLVCKDKKCQDGQTSLANGNEKKCTTSSDCKSDEKCLGKDPYSKCIKSTDTKCNPQFADDDAECSDGESCIVRADKSHGYCVNKKYVTTATACRRDSDCNYGLKCLNSKKTSEGCGPGSDTCSCQSLDKGSTVYKECSSTSQCKDGLSCRAATNSDAQAGKDSGSNPNMETGTTYCMAKLNLGHSCASDSQCSTGQKCQQTYNAAFVTAGNVSFKEKTSTSKCGAGEELETKTQDGKQVYACKTTAKQCANPSNPVTQAPTQLGVTSLDISAQCKADPGSRGRFTEGMSNECLNCGACTICDIMNVVTNFARYATMFLAPIGGLMIVISGLMYMTSGGNEERKGKAKKALGAAIIGMVIMMSGWLIINSVMSAVGAKQAGSWYKPSFTCPTDAWKWKGV